MIRKILLNDLLQILFLQFFKANLDPNFISSALVRDFNLRVHDFVKSRKNGQKSMNVESGLKLMGACTHCPKLTGRAAPVAPVRSIKCCFSFSLKQINLQERHDENGSYCMVCTRC